MIFARYKHTCKECGKVWYESHGDVLTGWDFRRGMLRCPKCGGIQSDTEIDKPQSIMSRIIKILGI